MMTEVEYSKLAMDKIPEEDKKAYTEAMEKAPDLVQKESNFKLFLEACNNQVDAAAQKLAQYWKTRKHILGPEKAFRPMTISTLPPFSTTTRHCKNRAISDDVLQIIQRCVLVQLPDDDKGRPVLCHDESMGTRTIQDPEIHAQQLASVFCNVHRVAMGENASAGAARTKGMVLICTIHAETFDPVKFRPTIGMILECMPLKIHKLHFCCSTTNAEEQRHVSTTLAPMLGQQLEPLFPGKVCVHVGEPLAILKALKSEGLKENYLPAQFGGTWSFERNEPQHAAVSRWASTSTSSTSSTSSDSLYHSDNSPDDSSNNKYHCQNNSQPMGSRTDISSKTSRLVVENRVLRIKIAQLLKQIVTKLLRDLMARVQAASSSSSSSNKALTTVSAADGMAPEKTNAHDDGGGGEGAAPEAMTGREEPRSMQVFQSTAASTTRQSLLVRPFEGTDENGGKDAIPRMDEEWEFYMKSCTTAATTTRSTFNKS